MAEFPALPLWTDAYLADTRMLSTLEHGAYLLLLIEAWRRPHCDLPDDDQILARLAGLPMKQWALIKPVVMGFWKLDKKRKIFTQKRLAKERAYTRDKSALQKQRIAKRWNNRTNKDTAVLPVGYRMDTPTPTPTPTIKEEETSSLKPRLETRAKSKSRGQYAFEGETIRLNHADLEKWRTAFDAIPDILAELQSIDIWLQGESVSETKRKNWFQSVSGMLNRKHQEARAARLGQRDDEPTDLSGVIRQRQRWREEAAIEAAKGMS